LIHLSQGSAAAASSPQGRTPAARVCICRRSGHIRSSARFGGELREALVVGGLEGIGAFAGGEARAARDRAAVEIEPAPEQPAATERRVEYLRKVKAIRLRAGHRAALASLPAARLEPQEILDPAPDVVLGLQRDVGELAAAVAAVDDHPQPARVERLAERAVKRLGHRQVVELDERRLDPVEQRIEAKPRRIRPHERRA
jgi:hypothetical protein